MVNDVVKVLCTLIHPNELSPSERVEETHDLPWKAIVREAARHGVLPLLWSSLKESGSLAQVPPRERAAIAQAHMMMSAHNGRIISSLAEISTAFRGAGLRAIATKGAHLIHSVYGSEHPRWAEDIDLLVPESDALRAGELLCEMEYSNTGPLELGRERGNTHHFPPFTKPNAVPIEIHWWPINRDRLSSIAIDMDGVFSRAKPTRIGSCDVLMMDKYDLLMHLCLHHTAQHRMTLHLRHFVDIFMFCRRFGSEIDWSELQCRAESWSGSKHLYAILAITSQLQLLPIDENIVRSVRPADFDDSIVDLSLERLFEPIDLRDRPRRDLCCGYIAIGRTRGFVRKGRYFLRWLCFPNPSHLRLNYPQIKNRSQLVLYYLISIFDSLAYILYDARFRASERDRIRLEDWCTSGDSVQEGVLHQERMGDAS